MIGQDKTVSLMRLMAPAALFSLAIGLAPAVAPADEETESLVLLRTSYLAGIARKRNSFAAFRRRSGPALNDPISTPSRNS